ncbi:MAG TPA: hypothetical protein PKU97_00840 [Kofleriaceae bacterium]|nr:hypothetical protein [Kofleriaceae bacterium]
MRLLWLPLVLVACSSRAPQLARPPMTAQDHLSEAERHEAEARALEARAAEKERAGTPTPYTCGDSRLNELATSGGERLHVQTPCWAGELSAIQRDRSAADRLRAEARQHRSKARAMVLSERAWCAGLPTSELDHTPFDHREDLLSVRAEIEGDRLRGARVRFRRVPGLTVEWLRQTLACHQAIAAIAGYDPLHLSTSPSVVAGAESTVIDDPRGIEVVIRSNDPAAALVVYARAEALLDPGAP